VDDLHKELKRCKCIDRRCGKDRRVAVTDIFTGTERRSCEDMKPENKISIKHFHEIIL